MKNELINQTIISSKYSWMREVFFYLGLLGAFGLRIVLILSHTNPLYAKIIWYASMITLSVFYCYRLWIESKRRKLILENNLQRKIYSGKLDTKDRENIAIILNSVALSKLKINILALFLMSVLALIAELIIDLKLF